MKEQGLEYFKDFYNLIDTSQFIFFILTFLIKMVYAGGNDALFVMLLEGVLLF